MSGEKINVYTCQKCNGETVTVDVDDGTTPFMLACRVTAGCVGMAQSSMYRPRPGHAAPEWEWYRPSPKAVLKASPAMRQHAEMGGLFIRARG